MSETDDLLMDINNLRNKLELLIKKRRSDLLAPDVIAASQTLNAALNHYNKFLKDKLGSE
jgi:hypothetical protein